MTNPTEIINNAIWSNLNNLHTALPGIVKAYDPTTNKATIQPALNKAFLSGEMPMPILENVPIMFPGGTDFNITYPINVNDYVLLIFVERSIDLWLSVGGQVTPRDPRKFDLSDAIAIPGLQPFNSDFSGRNNNSFQINYAGSSIIIGEDGAIQIKTASTVAIGNATTELLNVVSQILSYIANPVGVNVPSVPFVGPLVDATAAATLKTQLDLIKGTIT
jgi:Phage protein Gp138 N-terminal domain